MEWQLDFREVSLNRNEMTVYVGQVPTKLGVDTNYRITFYWFWSVTFVFLPLLLLGVFNSFLIVAVHKSRRDRRRMTQVEYMPFAFDSVQLILCIELIPAYSADSTQ